MSAGIIAGNVASITVIEQTISPAEVATVVTVEQDFTVPGLKVGDAVIVNPPGITASGSVCAARVKAANTLSIQFVNPSAGNVTPLSGVYRIIVMRREGNAAASKVMT